MKREPNPYSKNPILTVTNTMSISVPSMVAEDVLDGTDTPIITTDPEVHGRIDAVSGAVELMDTRIDAVSNMSELLYGSCVSADELLNDRIDAVSGAVDLMDTRIDGVSNMLALNGSGSSSGSSDVVLGEDLKKISFNITNDGVLYPSVQGTYESRLNYCSGISCCYFRDPSGGEWIHHAEMRFQKNTSTSDVEIQLRRDDSHDWITVASTANTSSSESGGGISFSTRGGTDYSLGFEVDKNADDYSAVVSLTSTGSNEFSGITALSTWLGAPSSDIGDTHVFMAVSGMGTLVFKSSAGMSKYDLSNLGGSSDSTDSKLEIKSKENENFDKQTFIVEISKTYRDPVMSLQLYDSERNTSQLYAVAAPWFASSDSSNYGMRIVPDSDLSNMLELTTNGGYSWNKLPWPTASEGSSGSSEGIAAQSAVKFLSVAGDYSTVQGITLQPYYDYGTSNYDSAIIDLKLDTVSGQEFSGIVALRAGMAAPNKSDYDGNVTMEVSGMGVLLFQKQGHYESYDLNNLGGGSGSVTTLTAITGSMHGHGVQFDSYNQVFINAHDGSLVRSESNRLVSKQYTSDRIHNSTYPYLELHGSSTLRWYDGGGVTEISLASLSGGGSSGSSGSLPANLVQFSGAGSLMFDLVNAGLYLGNQNVRTYRITPSYDSDCVYAVQMLLAASGIHNAPYKDMDVAARTAMALVEGPSQSDTPSIMWATDDGQGFRKWEPWKEAGSSSSSGSSFYWSDTKMPTSSIVATLSYPDYSDSDKDAVLIDNPLYAGQYNARPCAVRPYISDNGTLTWKRRHEAGSWVDLGASGTTFNLGLYDGSIGNDSGSVMLPLVTTPESNGVFRFDDQISLCRWETGWSADDALTNRSGIKTLIANPIALFDSAYKDLDSNYVSGAVRLVNIHGKITWQKANYSTGYWEAMEDASTSSATTMCLYTKKLANADSGTNIHSIAASVGFGFNWTSSTDLGYLIINRQGVNHKISLHDLNWLLSNKAKLAELLK